MRRCAYKNAYGRNGFTYALSGISPRAGLNLGFSALWAELEKSHMHYSSYPVVLKGCVKILTKSVNAICTGLRLHVLPNSESVIYIYE